MKTEPAVLISTITALFTAAIGCAIAFGIDISKEQQDAMLKMLGAMVSVLLILGPVIRTFVFSPRTVEEKVDEAAQKGAQGETQAPVVP